MSFYYSYKFRKLLFKNNLVLNSQYKLSQNKTQAHPMPPAKPPRRGTTALPHHPKYHPTLKSGFKSLALKKGNNRTRQSSP
jgi:hypothetical protein